MFGLLGLLGLSGLFGRQGFESLRRAITTPLNPPLITRIDYSLEFIVWELFFLAFPDSAHCKFRCFLDYVGPFNASNQTLILHNTNIEFHFFMLLMIKNKSDDRCVRLFKTDYGTL